MRRSALTPIFNRKIRYGHVQVGHQIGAPEIRADISASTVTRPATVIAPTAVGDPCIALTGALFAAITGLSPLSYWTLSGNNANTLKDWGSLGHDLTNNAAMPLNVTPGPDGCGYPQKTGGDAANLEAADDIAYEPQNAGGLTVFYLVKSRSGGEGGLSFQTVMKLDSAGNGSWRHAISTGTASGYFARTITAAGGTARTRTDTGTMAIDTWHKCITRFDSSSTGFPGLRRAGVNITGSTGGTGTANSNSSQTVRLYGHGGNVGRFEGTLAHVAIFAGQLSDANCAAIEAAATTDGW